MPDDFERFDQQLTQGGIPAALDFLAGNFLNQKSYHQLFEVLKIRARFDSGLPLMYRDEIEGIEPEKQKEFENRLVASCRTVGELFFCDGDAQNGWVYYQPVGDRKTASQLLKAIPVSDENRDEIIHVAVGEGVAAEYGFDLMLKNLGTCNSITAFDGQIGQLPKADRRNCAALLVQHLHEEICANIKSHIEQQEGAVPTESSLEDLVIDRDWLFADGGHHVDTTHLASVVRIARNVEDLASIETAIGLSNYGMRLDSQFHFEGDEPFTQTYEDHLRFFRGLKGDRPEETNAWFHKKLNQMEPGYGRNVTVELFVDFLSRSKQIHEGIRVSLKEMGEDHQPMGLAPTLFELAEQAGNFDLLINEYSKNKDLLRSSIGKMMKVAAEK